MQALVNCLEERRAGDGDILAPALVKIMSKVEPRLHSNVRKLMAKFIPPWKSLEYDVLQYLSVRYHEIDKEEVKLQDHVLPVGMMWNCFQFEAAEKAAQLMNWFDMTNINFQTK